MVPLVLQCWLVNYSRCAPIYSHSVYPHSPHSKHSICSTLRITLRPLSVDGGKPQTVPEKHSLNPLKTTGTTTCYSTDIICLILFSADPERFREDLLNIARTTLSSKILVQHRDHFAKLAVDAVLRLKVSIISSHM